MRPWFQACFLKDRCYEARFFKQYRGTLSRTTMPSRMTNPARLTSIMTHVARRQYVCMHVVWGMRPQKLCAHLRSGIESFLALSVCRHIWHEVPPPTPLSHTPLRTPPPPTCTRTRTGRWGLAWIRLVLRSFRGGPLCILPPSAPQSWVLWQRSTCYRICSGVRMCCAAVLMDPGVLYYESLGRSFHPTRPIPYLVSDLDLQLLHAVFLDVFCSWSFDCLSSDGSFVLLVLAFCSCASCDSFLSGFLLLV